jgi:hypothetical protein
MKRTPDVELVLRDYFADDGLTAPDFILDVVEARIRRQPQRRGWPFPGRTNVTTPIKLIAGLAAALIVAVVGYSLLPGTTGPGAPTTAPTPSARPTAEATASPSPSAVLPSWYTTSETSSGPGILPAGGHTTRSFKPGFTFSVPDGWVNDTDSVDFFSLFPDTPANQAQFARSEGLAQSMVMAVYPNPWFTCESVENNRGATAAEMVAAAMANEALAVSEPVDVAIGGLTGKWVDVRRNPDWTGTCPGDSDLPSGLDPRDERTRGIFLDVAGRGVLVMLLYSMSSAETEAFLAAAMPIVESFEFDLGQ